MHNINMADFDHTALRRLDLNLLVALDALVAERSVTRAAARLCVGQPAMSHALARLREWLGDDILYREGAAMVPTARAQALAPRVRQWLAEAQAMTLSEVAFDPQRVQERFDLCLNDPLEALLLPGLVAALRQKAPGLSLSVRPVPAWQQLEQLDAGEIRMALGHFPRLRSVHEPVLLFRSGFGCVYNPALLKVPARPRPADLARLPNIHTSYAGDGPGLVDKVFQQQGLRRQVVAHTANPLSIPFVVKQSPLVAVLPDMLTRLFGSHGDLRIVPLPWRALVLPISMVTHRRDASDPLVRFVTQELLAVTRAVFA